MKSDFNMLADDYAKFRTSYSDDLFAAILDYARAPAGGEVLDLACGTGLSMVPYLQRGFAVTGVDVAAGMIEQARLMVPAGSKVAFHIGSAEALPFAGASFDLISCAQAFHWLDPDPAFAECARVLRPGGTLAIFWKHAARDDVLTLASEQIIRDWLGDAAAISSRDHAIEHEAGWDIFWKYVNPAGAAFDSRPFADGRKIIIDFTQKRTVATFVGYQRSREKIRTVVGARREEFLAELERRLLAIEPADGIFTQRQVQYAFLARRSI